MPSIFRRYVIHTVGPVVEGSADDADRALLASCYRSCLDAANDLGCRTIAFCCISTGVFGFPQEEAAPIAVNAVVSWLDEHSGSSFERVIFDVFGDGDFALYRELLG